MLTSTTAPGKNFHSRAELAEHYKSDWHKYNLKRREAGLPLLGEQDFKARWEAALALRKEREAQAHGVDHLKAGKRNKSKTTREKEKQDPPTNDGTPEVNSPPKSKAQIKLEESQENPEIEPKQSLFDMHTSETLEANVAYMQENFGFFLPDQECLVDLEGLLGYCQEKIKLGHYCLYCEKMFPTWQGCQKHMISKQHTKLKYEQGYWEELDPFYDFNRDNARFAGVQLAIPSPDVVPTEGMEAMHLVEDDDENTDDNDGWEDMSDDENEEEIYDGYEKEIARFGLDVTALGELVFPDGRIIGHRGLARYYKQRVRTNKPSTAIVAAKQAAGERLYEGRVVNIGGGIPGDQMKGAGKGILVGLKDGAEGFSAVSLYRYRAAIRKQRRDDDVGRRLHHRSKMNINRMDKKNNRLMNGVSVAHAAR